jgi:hypothetical protein
MTHYPRKFRLPLLFFIPSALFTFMFILGSTWSVVAQDGVLPLPGSDGSNRAFGEVQQLTASDGAAGDTFGLDLALDGDILLEGNYPADSGNGAAYIFERSGETWSEVTRLTPSDAGTADYFAYDIDLYSTTAVVGAPLHDPDTEDAGAVYVFTRDNAGVWTEAQKLIVDGLPAFAFLGSNVAINGDRILAAAQGTTKAYMFKRNASQVWQLETDIELGMSPFAVKIDGDKALIGTPNDSSAKGAAHLYQLQAGSWTFVKKLTASDAVNNDLLGYKLDLQDDEVFVFALLQNPPNSSRGAVYVFSENGGMWTQTQKLAPNDHANGDYFGWGLAVDGEKLVISSYGDSSTAGSVYIFGWNGSAWIQEDKIPAVGGAFGYSVDLDEEVLASGAPVADSSKGRVYVYSDPDLLPTATPTITNTPVPVTETPIPVTSTPPSEEQVELLIDGGFEANAAGWAIKNATGDKVKCNKIGKVFAHQGNCAWRFKGDEGENAKIQQVITSGTGEGDSLTLSGYVNASGAVESKMKVVVSYLNSSTPKDKLTVSILAETGGVYTPLSSFQPVLTISVAAPPEKIKVQVKNDSTSGKVYYDALSLSAQ